MRAISSANIKQLISCFPTSIHIPTTSSILTKSEDNLFTLHGLCSLQKYAKKKTYMGYKGNAGAFCGLSMMVSRIKSFFGNFSTEWFGQENGLKQDRP
jgi:hypothetical protein